MLEKSALLSISLALQNIILRLNISIQLHKNPGISLIDSTLRIHSFQNIFKIRLLHFQSLFHANSLLSSHILSSSHLNSVTRSTNYTCSPLTISTSRRLSNFFVTWISLSSVHFLSGCCNSLRLMSLNFQIFLFGLSCLNSNSFILNNYLSFTLVQTAVITVRTMMKTLLLLM